MLSTRLCVPHEHPVIELLSGMNHGGQASSLAGHCTMKLSRKSSKITLMFLHSALQLVSVLVTTCFVCSRASYVTLLNGAWADQKAAAVVDPILQTQRQGIKTHSFFAQIRLSTGIKIDSLSKLCGQAVWARLTLTTSTICYIIITDTLYLCKLCTFYYFGS